MSTKTEFDKIREQRDKLAEALLRLHVYTRSIPNPHGGALDYAHKEAAKVLEECK